MRSYAESQCSPLLLLLGPYSAQTCHLPGKNFARVVRRELEMLRSCLPNTMDAAIYVVADEDRLNILKALITGACVCMCGCG